MKKSSQPRTISSAISSTLKDLGLTGKMAQYEVLTRWGEIVGQRISGVATAEHIHDGKLIVSVSRSAWRNELLFLKKELIERINTAMHQQIVKDIIFR